MTDVATENPAEAFTIDILDDPKNNPFYPAALATVNKAGEGNRFGLAQPVGNWTQVEAALRAAANASGLRLYGATPKDANTLPAQPDGHEYRIFKLRKLAKSGTRKPKGDSKPAAPKGDSKPDGAE